MQDANFGNLYMLKLSKLFDMSIYISIHAVLGILSPSLLGRWVVDKPGDTEKILLLCYYTWYERIFINI